jgi:replicative DNA helicase
VSDKPEASELSETVVDKAERRREYFENHDGEFEGWSTGFKKVDDITGGIPREGLYLLSGGPGVGKTTLAGHVAASVARKIPVIYLTYENNPISLVEKILCANAPGGVQSDGLKIDALRRGLKSQDAIDELKQRASNKDFLRRLRVVGPNSISGKWSISRLREEVRDIVSKNPEAEGVDDDYSRPECLVVIDYLQHWAKRDPENNELPLRERIEWLAGTLSVLNSSAGGGQKSNGEERPRTAVLAIASQNRHHGYGQPDRGSGGEFRSSLSSLKESGDLEYIADVVMFLVRDGKLTGSDDVRDVILEVVKNRHGRLGTVDLTFRGDTAQFWPR